MGYENAPPPHIARALHAEPGHCIADTDGALWRWSGAEWTPLRPGDTVLSRDRECWHIWDGHKLMHAAIEPGAVVRLDWHRDGVDWTGQLCTVIDTEQGTWNGENDPALLLLVQPFVDDVSGEHALVPHFVAELIAPAPKEVPST